jgi:hypothetical protein
MDYEIDFTEFAVKDGASGASTYTFLYHASCCGNYAIHSFRLFDGHCLNPCERSFLNSRPIFAKALNPWDLKARDMC